MRLAPTLRAHWLLTGFLILSAAMSTGCISVGTTSRAPEKQVAESRKSALTGRRLSAASEQTLRLALLDEVARDHPDLALRNLVALGDRPWGPTSLLGSVTAAAELALVEGRRLESTQPRSAAGYFLTAAELSQGAVLRALRDEASPLDPDFRLAAEIYNYSTGRLTVLVRDLIFAVRGESGWPESYELVLESPVSRFRVELSGDLSLWNPDIFELRPADEIRVDGLRNRHRHYGLGSPMVIARRDQPERTLPTDGLFRSYWNTYALTSIVNFSDPLPREGVLPDLASEQRARLGFHDPLVSEEVAFGDQIVPMQADYTAPLAVMGEIVEPKTNAQRATLRSERYLDEAGIYIIEPYRPDKIPLVLVHGLQSSALTWLELANDLRGDAELRERYQLWAFSYPTGLPFEISAAILHQSLEQTLDLLDPQPRNPATSQMVMIGHSMGGMLVRYQATSAGRVLWDAVASRPLEESDLAPADIAFLSQAYMPEPVPELSRAIFIATPHRGSRLAAGAFGRLVSSLVKLPKTLSDQFFRLVDSGILPAPERHVVPDGIDSLSPDGPALKALAELPVTVPFHTIVGDRNPDDDQITDGIVPFTSSDLEGAESVVIVPGGHNVHQDPVTIAEVRRILIEHLRKIDAPPPTVSLSSSDRLGLLDPGRE